MDKSHLVSITLLSQCYSFFFFYEKHILTHNEVEREHYYESRDEKQGWGCSFIF